mmetsp:Transcript_34057/g.76681  ORF Transcript_34057/g.76681 Transcript_34057/m.76681 type:complete len:200 (+) Transcript_34057:2211-2810(+)
MVLRASWKRLQDHRSITALLFSRSRTIVDKGNVTCCSIDWDIDRDTSVSEDHSSTIVGQMRLGRLPNLMMSLWAEQSHICSRQMIGNAWNKNRPPHGVDKLVQRRADADDSLCTRHILHFQLHLNIVHKIPSERGETITSSSVEHHRDCTIPRIVCKRDSVSSTELSRSTEIVKASTFQETNICRSSCQRKPPDNSSLA